MRQGLLFGTLVAAVLVSILFAANTHNSFTFGLLNTCFSLDSLRILCARPLVRSILGTYTPAELISRFSEHSDQYQCHVLGHVVGQELFRAHGVERALLECSPECNNACHHGVLADVFTSVPNVHDSLEKLRHPDVELLRTEGSRLCTSRQGCHAVGHVVFATLADLANALTLCDSLTTATSSDDCHRGVFMESFTNILQETMGNTVHHDSENADDLLFPCNTSAVPDQYKRSCYYLLSMNQAHILKERGIVEFSDGVRDRVAACESLHDERFRRTCVEGIGWSLYEATNSVQHCERLTPISRDACLFGLAASYVDFGGTDDTLLALCLQVEHDEARRACFRGLFVTLSRTRDDVPNLCDQTTDVVCNEVHAEVTKTGLPQ
jgi:hypothetical protein